MPRFIGRTRISGRGDGNPPLDDDPNQAQKNESLLPNLPAAATLSSVADKPDESHLGFGLRNGSNFHTRRNITSRA